MIDLRVRPYRPSDRRQVRSIAYATGYMGDPPTWYWRHRESFADVWTSYYTDVEPDSLLVAEDGDRACGEPHLLPGMRSPAGGRNHLQLMVVDFGEPLRRAGAAIQRC
jgi:hypothetical protein